MEICHRIPSAFSARPTLLSVKQQGMLARVLAVTHIQTLKVVPYKLFIKVRRRKNYVHIYR